MKPILHGTPQASKTPVSPAPSLVTISSDQDISGKRLRIRKKTTPVTAIPREAAGQSCVPTINTVERDSRARRHRDKPSTVAYPSSLVERARHFEASKSLNTNEAQGACPSQLKRKATIELTHSRVNATSLTASSSDAEMWPRPCGPPLILGPTRSLSQAEPHLNISTIPDIESSPVIRLCNLPQDISGEQHAQVAMEALVLPDIIIGEGSVFPARSDTQSLADTSLQMSGQNHRLTSDAGQGLDGNWYELIGYSEAASATSDVDDFFAVGLMNLGNTCYINAVLHALARLSTVRRWTTQHRILCHRSDGKSGYCPLCELACDLSVLTSREQMSSYEPLSAKKRASWGGDRFANYLQHDASEAFTGLLTACDEVDGNAALALGISADKFANDTTSSRYSTPYYRAFGGITTSTLKCNNRSCTYEPEKEEIFHCLTLEMPTIQSTIKQLLERHWSSQDLIDEGDRCHVCQAPKSQSKSIRLTRWPQILVLHLKRLAVLSHNPSIYRKNDTKITFEDSMPVAGKTLPYKLRAVIVHHGRDAAGHYIAMVRDQNGRWYKCDDFAPPTRMTDARVMTTEPYMLFYEA